MRRVLVLLVAAVAPLALGSTAAQAAPGGMDDPKGDWTSGSGPFDIKRVIHDNDASTMKYTIEHYNEFDLNKASYKFEIDCTPTDSRGDDMYVQALFYGGRGVVVDVYHSGKSTKVASGTISKAGTTVTVTYARSAMAAPCTGSYNYDLYAGSSQERSHVDVVPNAPNGKLTHNLAVVATTTTAAPTTTTVPPTTVAPTTTSLAATTTTEAPAAASDEGDDGSSAAPWLIGGVAVVLLGTAIALAVRARSRR